MKKLYFEGFKMACELLALEICDYLHSDCKDETCDWDVLTWSEFPGVINQDDDSKDVFVETLNMYLRAASVNGRWQLDSDRDDCGVEVVNNQKMILHLIKE